ncbi:MAG TPA: bifunctional homocysteine S-methyltransferase/methylenetetrahydrofolate reductase [Kofleriaceae bacterium]|nr:bifunctional homocysteine S-methyltransferase/methylenetetrahydrofolate reductase [Kofleriaceae bacterium]
MDTSSPRAPFVERLSTGALLLDGAMGSVLYDRGVLHTRSYDELNLSQPDLITRIHDEYVTAGADLIETNTFAANRIALTKHGLADRVVDINRAGVELARKATHGRAYVAGAVGPTGVAFRVAGARERKLARYALAEQIEALVLADVDALILETFASIVEIEEAIRVAKERAAKVPILAMMVFDVAGHGDGDLSPAEIADRLIASGADAVGANCSAGPAELYQVTTAMVGRGRPVIAQPNAGNPSVVDGRTLYVANAETFGVYTRRLLKGGVGIVGGCCGTTPQHTRAMYGAIRMLRGEDASVQQVDSAESVRPEPAVALAERSRLGRRIAEQRFAVSVELTSPAGLDLTKTKAAVSELLTGGVGTINIADGPRASARMSNLAVCARLAAETAAEPILHVCARDRSLLGLVAHLLGAHALGIRNLVIITGDPPKMGDYPNSSPVYDVDSIGLLRIAAGLNAGVDPAGKQCEPTSFVLATGAEPGARDRERELRRLEQKQRAGAELVMTQPVYDPRTLESFLADAAPLGLPIMVGILPLASHRNAEFLHNEVPGMSIPAEYRERMAKAGAGPAAREEGIKIAREALNAVSDRVAGVYVMPPFNRVDAALAVLDVVRDRLAAR